jgi:signal transduction histidine kinase
MATLILVVEDERIVAMHLRQELTKLGYDVVGVVASGKQALEKVSELHPDVLLMDIHIEGEMDGIETAARLPEDLQIPVVFLTAYSEEATLARARAMKPYGYLVKPFAARELHATIQMSLERRAADLALRESEKRLRLALEAAETGSRNLALTNERLHAEIVERRRIEREREALIVDLERKNEEMERFCYTISHDLKAPLITICGFADLLQQDTASGDLKRVAEDVDEIATAAHVLQRMLDDLLDLSSNGKIVEADREVSLVEVVNHAKRLLGAQILDNRITLKIAEDLPVIVGDYNRLVAVFQNLIENAIKYKGNQAHPWIAIRAKTADGEVTCSVQDNGRGIHPRYQEHVFGLFARFQAEGGGKGIGLALVKRIIEAHGGRIWLDSEGEDQGCTFSFTLPAARLRAR